MASSEKVLRESVDRWSQFATDYGTLENTDKTQWVIPRRKQHFEVLGATIGSPPMRSFGSIPANKKRLDKAQRAMRRIATVPSRWTRLKDLTMIARPAMSYGWISGALGKSQATSYNTQLWQSAGRCKASPPSLRTLVAGAHLQANEMILLRQIRLKAMRDKDLSRLGHDPDQIPTRLEDMVRKGLRELGWNWNGQRWPHPLCGHFNPKNIVFPKEWKRICRLIRDSVRLLAWEEFKNSDRREIEGGLPEMSLERINFVRKFVQKEKRMLAPAIGAVNSPMMKFKLFGKSSQCGKCGLRNPSWTHGWQCHLGIDPPEDIMLRRFLRPTDPSDYALAKSFMDNFEMYYP